MTQKIRRYLPFVNAGLQEASTYKVNWIFYILSDILGCFVSFFVWQAVYKSNGGESFMGFDRSSMVVYIFLTFMSIQIIGSDATFNIAQEIKDGSISMRIIKPISYNTTFLFQEIGNKIMNIGVVFIPLVVGVEVYRFAITGTVQFDILKFLVYLFSCIIAYLINFFFNICYGFTAFVFKNLWGSNLLKDCIVGFLSGAVIPLAFMPDVLRVIMTILPFASLSYTPVMIYMGKYSGTDILIYMGLQIFWCIAFWVLTKVIWKCVIKRLCVQGG